MSEATLPTQTPTPQSFPSPQSQLDPIPKEKPFLDVHEWLAVVIISGFLGMLTFLSWISAESPILAATELPLHVLDPFIHVNVKGAVGSPGKIKVKKGSTIQEVLELAQVLPEANLKSLKLNRKVRSGQTLNVPTVEMITIHIEGAVNNPGPMTVPKGMMLYQIIQKIESEEGIELPHLKKKRKVRDQETIRVPTKLRRHK
jgi:hypothetical protein